MLKTVEYETDLCVIGGGLAGICTAVAAARGGARVVLMHERAMLGGNASSEIRMWVCGAQGKNVRETGICEEIALENLAKNPYKLYPMWDAILYEKVKKEPNITLLLNCSCMDAKMKSESKIESVTGWQMTTERFCRVRAKNFADCSGDGILAPLTGAHFRHGREAKSEFGENLGVPEADRKTMGNSCLIEAHKGSTPVTFTPPDFAKKLTEDDLRYRHPDMKSEYENFWYLELGGTGDTIDDAESTRDELLSLAYGMWDYIKNSGKYEDAKLWQLDFIGFLPGKRESRRYVGEYVLTQSDISSGRDFPDTVAYGGWALDDHDPAGFYYDGHPNTTVNTPSPYAIPYRALYSENIDNLFFAGRDISVTHAALSSTRVMLTCAVCGEAVGNAAAIANKYGVTPHGVFLSHLDELQSTLLFGDCMLPHRHRTPSDVVMRAALTLNGKPDVKLDALRDGCDRENVFVCRADDVIECRFDAPAEIREIRLIFDSDLDRNTLPGSYCERYHAMRCNLLPTSPVMHLPTTLCRSFRVEAELDDGGTVTVADEKNNIYRRVCIPACLERVFALRLVMREANCGGSEMRIFSLDVR